MKKPDIPPKKNENGPPPKPQATIRMSDILKRVKEKKQEARAEEKKMIKEASPTPVQEKTAPEIKIEEPKVPRSEVEKQKEAIPEFKLSPVITKKARVVSGQECRELYEGATSLMREILQNSDYASIDTGRIIAQAEKIVEQERSSKEPMLKLAYLRDSNSENNYLLCHSVNVCIYSIEIALGLGYEKSKLVQLGVSALLHDISMMKYLDLSNQPRKLTNKEYNNIKNHPQESAEIIKKINKNLPAIAARAAHEHHERIDGSGYPKGLKEESISEAGKILGLADTYEALLHPRPHRNEFLPSAAIEEILGNKSGFENRLVRILLERISVYPIGSLVELNTKEIAQVIKINRDIPLRPMVSIMYEADGKRLTEPRTINLVEQTPVHISRELKKKEIEIS